MHYNDFSIVPCIIQIHTNKSTICSLLISISRVFIIFDYDFPQSTVPFLLVPLVDESLRCSTPWLTSVLPNSLIVASQVNIQWYFIVVLLCISLMTKAIEHLFIIDCIFLGSICSRLSTPLSVVLQT